MRRFIGRYGFSIAVVALLAGIVGVGSFLVVVAGPDLARSALLAPSPSPTPAPSSSPLSPMGLSPIGISMPADADCDACHSTSSGIGTKTIPVMAHPLWGWRDCTACHSTGSLVKSAPGHSGLHKDQCLICHKTQSEAGTGSPPPLRPEHMGTDKPCTACHGVDQHAPLPESMAGRGNNCWICHNGPEYRYLFEQGASAPPTGDPGASVATPDASASPSQSASPSPAAAGPTTGPSAPPTAVRYPLEPTTLR